MLRLVRFENLTGPRSLEALQKFAESPRFQRLELGDVSELSGVTGIVQEVSRQ